LFLLKIKRLNVCRLTRTTLYRPNCQTI